MRIGLGIVFVWFGALKVVGSSPAAELVTKTVYWFDPAWFVPFLGWWEVAIGVCLAVPALTRVGIALLALQMPGTFLPLVLLPQVCFQDSVFHLTLEGQYIVKNLVIIGSALVLGGLVRKDAARPTHFNQMPPTPHSHPAP
ncbi:MAG: hypothetical protein D6724_09220 [Armatimonadetes bacterium]|nr:MAG: hypothetical protein D6724_09220 [Armatimonadota bacterium]